MKHIVDDPHKAGRVTAVRVVATDPGLTPVFADFETFAEAVRYCMALPSVMKWPMVMHCQGIVWPDVELNVDVTRGGTRSGRNDLSPNKEAPRTGPFVL